MDLTELKTAWAKITQEDIKDSNLVHALLFNACDSHFVIRQAGVVIPWEDLPAAYRESVMLILCIKFSGGSLDKLLQFLDNQTE